MSSELAAYLVLMAQPALALVGVIVNAISLHSSWVDLQLTAVVNGKRRLVAMAHVNWEVIRLLVQVLFLTMGLLTIINPPSPAVVSARSWVVIANRSCLMLATCLLMVKSILGVRYQHQLLRLWIAETTVEDET